MKSDQGRSPVAKVQAHSRCPGRGLESTNNKQRVDVAIAAARHSSAIIETGSSFTFADMRMRLFPQLRFPLPAVQQPRPQKEGHHPAQQPMLVSRDEIAEVVGVSGPTADRLTSTGKITSLKIRAHRLYDPRHVIGSPQNNADAAAGSEKADSKSNFLTPAPTESVNDE